MKKQCHLVYGFATLAGFAAALQVVIPLTLKVFEMEKLNLTCNATDYAEGINLTFSWRKISIRNFSVLGSNLVLAPIRTDDVGEYECQVNAGAYEMATGSVRIVVQFSPRWTLLSLNKFAGELGQSIVLNCSISAYPMCDFYWINPQGINLTSSVSIAIDSTGTKSLLSIKAIEMNDYGNYTCVANNAAGLSRFTLPLMKPGKPDSPQQCNATAFGSRSAVVECIPGFSGGASQLDYVVTKESPGSSGPQKAKSSLGPLKYGLVTINIDELFPGINYTLKIVAKNSYGQSDDSYGVLIWTPSDDSHSLPLAIIIGASVGGGLCIILLLVVIVICHLKCQRKCHVSTNQGKLDTDVVNEYHAFPTTRHGQQEITNCSVSRSHDLGMMQQENSAKVSESFLNLDHNPGESYIGYENLACADNLSFNQSQCSDYGKLAKTGDQLTLAGHGALKDIVEMSSFEKPKFVVKPCVIPIPPFQPNVPWELQKEKLCFRSKLGDGSYGETWEVEAEGVLGQPGKRMVSVKTLRADYTSEEEFYLYKDLEIMKLLQPHPNIILLLGCCSKTKPLYLLFELAANGNLLNLLRQQRRAFSPNNFDENYLNARHERHFNLTLQDLMKFALQVASGLDYISSNQLIHRDLAARNVLLDEHMVCKISDFGTIEDVIKIRQYDSRTKRRLPLRWMAPESLTASEYSTETDVWSFGILMWEIITLGSTPYPGHSGPQVLEYVQKGNHMVKPIVCPNALYSLMISSWKFSPTERPSFPVLKEKLGLVVEESCGNCIYADQMCENIFDILHNQPGEIC